VGDFEEKLNTILSSPDTMAQIMSIAQSLGLGNDQMPPPPPPQEQHDTNEDHLFSHFDPAILTRLLPLLSKLEKEDSSPHHQLLAALDPFLQEGRQEKLQKALRTARLICAGKTLLETMGDDHV